MIEMKNVTCSQHWQFNFVKGTHKKFIRINLF